MTNYSNIRYENTGVTTYANVAALPSSGNTAGDLAYVTSGSNSKPSMYIWNGYGWYKIDDVNTSPTMNDLGGSLTISQNSNNTITITASDVDENTTLQYKYEVTTGSLPSGTTITETDGTTAITANTYVNGNQFRINSGSTDGNYTLTFTVTDGINTSSDTKEVTMGNTWTLLKTITTTPSSSHNTIAYSSDETWSSVSKRYWKFEIHSTVSDNDVQFGEFKLKASSGYNSWNSGATVTAYRTDNGSTVSWTGTEGVDKGFDNNDTGNKAYRGLSAFGGTSGTANVTIIVDNTTNITTTGFNYYTANDSSGRSPDHIKIYYSDSSAAFD